MTKRELLKRIEALEARIAELEARQVMPIYVPPPLPAPPQWPAPEWPYSPFYVTAPSTAEPLPVLPRTTCDTFPRTIS